ncbi:MAG TPA: acyl-CoA synthetase [Vicinamibacterales bacterium]|nr:acyl-CoA synthetase [Vicinamibacterales bacterium]
MSDPLAIVAADGVFSYYDLAQAAARVASELRADADDLAEARVAFLVPPSFAHVVVSRGIWMAGGVAVPLAVSHPPTELEYVVRDAGASIVVAGGPHAQALAAIARDVGARFIRTADLIATDAEPRPPVYSLPDRRAMIVYTSGTTGRPKGVVTTHGNISAQIASLVQAWEWSRSDRALLALPLHHVHGIINVLGCALASGAGCEILPQFETEPAWERLASGDITVFSAVPTIYHRLIQSWDAASPAVRRARSDGCGALRLMMSGSAALPIGTLERWREITGHTLLERYGMTELGMVLSNPLHGARRPGFVGAPLPGVEVRLVDGEIEVRGPGIFLEYWQRPDDTRDAFHDEWFRTGDVAVVDDGAYRILGRRSVDIIKTGGFKVSALEIEEAIRAHPGILDCAVVGIPDPEWGERVAIAVEMAADSVVTLDQLHAWSTTRLAPYKIPRALRCVPALPRNVMGKVVKTEVVALFLQPDAGPTSSA